MKNEPKTKKQLTEELAVLRQKVEELEKSETEHKRMEEALHEQSCSGSSGQDRLSGRCGCQRPRGTDGAGKDSL
jgi:hypothetical protein